MGFWSKPTKGNLSSLSDVKKAERHDAVVAKEYLKLKKAEYKQAARKEAAIQYAADKEAKRRAGLTRAERYKEDALLHARKGAEYVPDPVKSKNKVYKNLGGSFTIRKDALGKLKRIGK